VYYNGAGPVLPLAGAIHVGPPATPTEPEIPARAAFIVLRNPCCGDDATLLGAARDLVRNMFGDAAIAEFTAGIHVDDGRFDFVMSSPRAVDFGMVRVATLQIGGPLTHAWEYAWEEAYAAGYVHHNTHSVGNVATIWEPPSLLPRHAFTQWERDQRPVARALRTAVVLASKNAASVEAFCESACRHMKDAQPVYYVSHAAQLEAMLRDEYIRLRQPRFQKAAWKFKRPCGWQAVVMRLLTALLNTRDVDILRRVIIDVTGEGDDGKGYFLDSLRQPLFWLLLGAEFPGCYCASDCRNLKDLGTGFRGEGVVTIDCAAGAKERIGSGQDRERVTMIERMTDYGGEVRSSKYRGRTADCSCIVLLFGNEPLSGTGALQRKRIYSIASERNPDNPHDTEFWRHVDPARIPIHFPGAGPNWIPPTGLLGKIARPVRRLPADPFQIQLDAWRARGRSFEEARRALNVADRAAIDAILDNASPEEIAALRHLVAAATRLP